MLKIINYLANRTNLVKFWNRSPRVIQQLIYQTIINIWLIPVPFVYSYYFIRDKITNRQTLKNPVLNDIQQCKNTTRDNSDLVLNKLHQLGYTIFKTDRDQPRISLLVANKTDLLSFFFKMKKNESVYVKFRTDIGTTCGARLCLLHTFSIKQLVNISNSFSFYQNFTNENGRVLYSERASCDVDIWLEDSSYYNLETNFNTPPYKIASKKWLEEKNLIINKSDKNPINNEPAREFPIDLVYTWVDDNDPEWLEKFEKEKEKYKGDLNISTSTSPERFRNRDELKYSLRSVDMYANFFRKIFIVTAGQVPEWLNTEHPQIQLVFHEDIMPEEYLPTFNSHAIESRLHYIKGLGEHFIYFNDDVFIGRKVDSEAFFPNEQVCSVFHCDSTFIGLNEPSLLDLTDDAAAKNNRDLIMRKFNKIVTEKFLHVPHPLFKSVLYEIDVEFEKELYRTTGNKFRSINDVSMVSSLFQHYALIKSRAVPRHLEHSFIDISRPNLKHLLDSIQSAPESKRPDTFCINDKSNTFNSDRVDSIIVEFLDHYYPFKSEFEV